MVSPLHHPSTLYMVYYLVYVYCLLSQKYAAPGFTCYRELLDYVQVVGEKCGFLMEEDRLRIPSTKRVCFIARKDSKQFNSEQVDANISEMTTKPVDSENW